MFVAGDIGGTKTVVALFEESGGSLALVRDDTFKSKDHKSLEEILGKFLKGDELVSLNPHAGAPRKGNVAVIAAGTGLGEAMLYFDGQSHHPLASEGGHCDFGPRTDVEIDLLRYLRDKFKGHVSYERVLSGPG